LHDRHDKKYDSFSTWQEYGVDFNRRRIILDDGIDDMLISGACCANLLWLDKSEGKIEFWINCPGGYITNMWAIYDLIQTAKNPIDTIGIGDVSSAAVLLLASGTGTRYAMPHAQLMHHQSQHSRPATEKELQDYAAQSAKDEELRLRTLAKHSNIKYAAWKRKSLGEWYMTAEEMLAGGVIDAIRRSHD
jgi:ATP-dependent Clp protease, protease subunit